MSYPPVPKRKSWLLFVLAPAVIASPLLTVEVAQYNPKAAIATAQPSNQATSKLPPKPFPVPGWLGFASVPANAKHKFPWSPSHPSGQIVIFSDAWSQVKPGTPLVALAPGVKQPVRFLRSSEERYGCDGVPTSMAAFSAPKKLSEGPVWVMRQQDTGTATALPMQDLPLANVPANLLPRPLPKKSDARAWKAGNVTIVLRKQSAYKAKLTLAINSRVVYSNIEEKYFFGGAEREPVNLSKDYPDPGIARPIGAFQLKAEAAPTIVLWQPGYEGHSFNIIVTEGKTSKLVEAGQVYFCAY